MRIAWIVNLPIGPLAKRLNLTSSSGSWCEAALSEVSVSEHQLYVITTCNIEEDIFIEEQGITYIALSLGAVSRYKHSYLHLQKWKEVFSKISPNILHIWGTEYPHSLSAILAKPAGCKALVYVQGVMESVCDNYYGGLSTRTLWANTSAVELLSKKSIFNAKKGVRRSSINEKKTVALADGIILETKWSEEYYRLVCGCKTFYRHILPINEVFFRTNRTRADIEEFSVFTPAADYPLKGIHQLIKAIFLVKKKYPKVKLYVPGYRIDCNRSFRQRIKTKSYRRYLHKLITKLDLWDNIEFTGPLKSNEMAERMRRSHVFVCCSAIENHSTTLREAMLVGVPCISTCVGGIPEILKNGYNGELYSFNDYVTLAGRISKLFENEEYARELSKNATQYIRDYYNDRIRILTDIYASLN